MQCGLYTQLTSPILYFPVAHKALYLFPKFVNYCCEMLYADLPSHNNYAKFGGQTEFMGNWKIENGTLDRGHGYRLNVVWTVHTTEVKILSFRPLAQ